MKIKSVLIGYRKKNNLSQQYMAELLNVTIRCYQYWEAGTHMPSGNSLVKIVKKLKIKNV